MLSGGLSDDDKFAICNAVTDSYNYCTYVFSDPSKCISRFHDNIALPTTEALCKAWKSSF